MNFIRKLFGTNDSSTFNLLKQSSDDALAAVILLVEVIKKFQEEKKSDPSALDELKALEMKERRVKRQITKELCATYVTLLDREDVVLLSSALLKITETADSLIRRFMKFMPHLEMSEFRYDISFVNNSAKIISEMVDDLARKKMRLDDVKDRYRMLNELESESNSYGINVLDGLFVSEKDPVKVIILKDLYEMMDRIVDLCREAGDVVYQIKLKYS